MFRAQQNVFDDAVAKATDENLTSENWEYIMDVCDRANSSDAGPKEVVSAIIKRLAHRNANVQLYTLELANALSQNCGVQLHTELASRSFTDALLRLANDRNTHNQVKGKILERMHDWTEMFSNDRNLGIMEQAYMRLKTQNPNLHPPSKPTKQQITDADRQKEEEELQMALDLSVKDRQAQAAGSSGQPRQDSRDGQSYQQQPAQPVPSGTTAATVSRVRALFDFQPSEPGELQFKKGDIIAVLESVYKDWWKGSLRGQTGIFPLNYVEKLSDPTQEELQREAQMEAEVFAEIKNVEKLLTLLSTSNSEMNVRDNEEITTLYHSTLAIRPKLIELIGKYSQRKDDFTQLNEKFIKARRDYEALLEASMSQPAQSHGYGRPGNYNYPPSGYPPQAPPPQHDPGRYYTPNPQDSRTPVPQQPPPNPPQPFYIAGQTPTPQQQQQLQQPQQHASYAAPDQRTDSPTAIRPAGTDPYGVHPPHELGTSSYASPPAEARRQSYPPHFQQQPQPQQSQQPANYSPSIYNSTPDDAYSQGLPQQQQQPPPQNAYPAPLTIKNPHAAYSGSDAPPPPPPQQQQQQQQAVYGQSAPPHQQQSQPPAYPPGGGPSSPGSSSSPYPNLGGAPQTYQAYQPPRQHEQGGYGAPGSNPNDYYR